MPIFGGPISGTISDMDCILYRKSSGIVTIGYSDTFANPQQCHCNRSSLYSVPVLPRLIMGPSSSMSSYQASLIGALIVCDLLKQVCNYGMRYFSRDQEYPIPQALLVAMLEIIKFTIVFVRTGGK